jgi:benzoyl-CoA reductase/2-hydroxyglutaryl-CoA dehydratase subunit BcrC/BadD/HgdB
VVVSLKEYLEHLIGTEITESVFREEIDVANRIRNLLIEISLKRRNDPPLISGKEYIELIAQRYFI